jgi:hypothetical protein
MTNERSTACQRRPSGSSTAGGALAFQAYVNDLGGLTRWSIHAGRHSHPVSCDQPLGGERCRCGSSSAADSARAMSLLSAQGSHEHTA